MVVIIGLTYYSNILPSLTKDSLSIRARDAQAASAAPCSANFLFFSLKLNNYKQFCIIKHTKLPK